MKTVRVDVKVENDRELKIVWNDELPWLPYTISRHAVEDIACEIRRVLAEIVEAGLNNDLKSCAHILKNLAQRGCLLYEALFTKIGGEADPQRIRVYYENLSTPFYLRFSVAESVFVPWGLVYSLDAATVSDEWPDDLNKKAWEPYRGFWCFEKQLSTMYYRIPPDAAGVDKDASMLDLVRVIHPKTFQNAVEPLSDHPEDGFLDWLKERYGEPLTTSKALEELWRKNGSHVGLLYFYCHASLTALALGESEKIEASRLLLMLSGAERTLDSQGCLVMINGCSTAVGAASGDFQLATARPGLCGFVGTETDVPDIFALRFSLGLLHLLFSGLSLGEAMQQMYRDHFPLSLVYGLYAHPSFRMPQRQAPRMAKEPPNFSFGHVGTNRLEA